MAQRLVDKYGAPNDPTEALLELANELVVGVFADKYDEKKRLREKKEDRDYGVRSQEISALRRDGYDGPIREFGDPYNDIAAFDSLMNKGDTWRNVKKGAEDFYAEGGTISEEALEASYLGIDLSAGVVTDADEKLLRTYIFGDERIYKKGLVHEDEIDPADIDELERIGLLNRDEIPIVSLTGLPDWEKWQDEVRPKLEERYKWWASSLRDNADYKTEGEFNQMLRQNLQDDVSRNSYLLGNADYLRAEKSIGSFETRRDTAFKDVEGDYLVFKNGKQKTVAPEKLIKKGYREFHQFLSYSPEEIVRIHGSSESADQDWIAKVYEQGGPSAKLLIQRIVKNVGTRQYYEGMAADPTEQIGSMNATKSASMLMDEMYSVQTKIADAFAVLSRADAEGDPNKIMKAEKALEDIIVHLSKTTQLPVQSIAESMEEGWEDFMRPE
jgi:hypothetical protein